MKLRLALAFAISILAGCDQPSDDDGDEPEQEMLYPAPTCEQIAAAVEEHCTWEPQPCPWDDPTCKVDDSCDPGSECESVILSCRSRWEPTKLWTYCGKADPECDESQGCASADLDCAQAIEDEIKAAEKATPVACLAGLEDCSSCSE